MLPSTDQWWFELSHFFHTGGWVLYAILIVCVVLMALILERIFFRFWVYRSMKNRVQDYAESSLDWRIKLSAICDLDLSLRASFSVIKILIAVCPMIGLLGTVTGMIQVFDSLAIYGTGNPRMMASGVASATFPTMTGMAVAVIGLLFYGRLFRWAAKERTTVRNLKMIVLKRRSSLK